MPTDNTIGALTAMLTQASMVYGGGVTSPPSSPFGAPPPAGIGGATNAYANAQASVVPEESIAPAIYLGKGGVYETEQDTPRGLGSQPSKVKSGDKTANPDDLLEEFAKASPAEQRKMALLLSLAGYNGEGSLEKLIVESFDMTLGDTLEAYYRLLDEASVRYQVHGHKVTPDQLLRRGIAYKMPASANWDGNLDSIGDALGNVGFDVSGIEEESSKASKEDKPFTGMKSTTSTSVTRDVMDPNDAKALTRSMLQRELGRDPTEGEFEDFISAIQYAQKTNPTKSTTKQSYEYKKGELVDQTSKTTTHSGIGSEGVADIALQKARSNPNWAEWQAMGTYAPALFEALGATVQGR